MTGAVQSDVDRSREVYLYLRMRAINATCNCNGNRDVTRDGLHHILNPLLAYNPESVRMFSLENCTLTLIIGEHCVRLVFPSAEAMHVAIAEWLCNGNERSSGTKTPGTEL
jgi:hypothetical protein